MTLLLTNMLYDDNRSEDCNDNRENAGLLCEGEVV